MTDPSDLEGWTRRLTEALGIADFEPDIALILDLARDAAHGVARPAAPLTTFIVGYAAGRAGGSADDIDKLSRTASALAAGDPAP
jgi:hypothetical protein